MPILLPDVVLKLQAKESLEKSIKMDLLALLVTKPIQFLTEIPQDWHSCLHVSVPHSIDPETGEKADWFDPEYQVRPALDNLVSHLASLGRIPIDICAVKTDEMYVIVVRTKESTAVAA